MRRLTRILSLIAATIIVIIALLISGLRLLMPHMNAYRSEVLSVVSSLTGAQIQADQLRGRWENFGPAIEVRGLTSTLSDGTLLDIGHVRLALDVWQSLLHAQLQFRDLTFWQLHLNIPTLPSSSKEDHRSLGTQQLENLFLRRFDHFILRDSSIRFPSPSGQQIQFTVPQLTWFNEGSRHQAEGEVSLSSLTGQHGAAQVRLDLNDRQGAIDNGRIWLQAADIDARPWLGRWIKDNTSLKSASVSLTAWVNLKNGSLDSGDLMLSKGGAEWQQGQQSHQLQLNKLTAHLEKSGKGWALSFPLSAVSTDNVPWAPGYFAVYWQPQVTDPLQLAPNSDIRLRASQLDLARLDPLIPLLAPLSPDLATQWQQLQPRGKVDALAVDYDLQHPQQSRFQTSWSDFRWQSDRQLPAISAVSGNGSGRLDQGQVSVSVGAQSVTMGDWFQAPLQVSAVSANVGWDIRDGNLLLTGDHISAEARSVAATGEFRYQQPQKGEPRLDILAGINVSDAGDAWRYFPHNLMGKELTDYLSGAVKGGTTRNATLLFAGDPHRFPFRQHDGMFQVSVPLRNATYAFQPDWPPLKNLDIDLNFVNDGLWMKAQKVALGNAQATTLTADIPDYRQEKLFINGDVRGTGSDIGHYFQQTPLAKSLGAALDEVQIKGQVGGHLNLDIPLNGKQVTATGNVAMNNNSLYIRPLKTTLTGLSGNFRYKNGDLDSDTLVGKWFGQPVSLNFTTREQSDDFAVDVGLEGNWSAAAVTQLPASLRSHLGGLLPWQGKVAITLPYHGEASYQVTVNGDAREVSSRLPSPLAKFAGTAFPFDVSVKGDLQHFMLTGHAGGDQAFSSRWLLSPQLRLDRGQWQSQTHSIPALPAEDSMVLNLPALQGEEWLSLFSGPKSEGNALRQNSSHFSLPGNIRLHTPALTLAGQRWNDLTVILSQLLSGESRITAQGKEIRGSLQIKPRQPWQLALDYLYYNPQWGGKSSHPAQQMPTVVNFSGWPALGFACRQCWLAGQNFGKIAGRLTPTGNKLVLTNGLVQAGQTRLTAQGEWEQLGDHARTALKGEIHSDNISQTTQWFGVSSPLAEAPVTLNYDLHWHNQPWQPDLPTLSGLLSFNAGKGVVTDVDTGAAGRILRLVSIDALLRKLRFDFSDSFNSKGFYFDSVKGTAWIENGVLRTDNSVMDGLEADIALSGKADLVQRTLDFDAAITPELSASVGVATAFVINPVVGVAVYAASKALGPLWSKIALLRYHIGGTLDTPEIKEVLRQTRRGS
ncbi:AsmA2 domain-containing protein YhdP [Tatumella saanichensis]|uniref:AsmA2 domain-containing protein YhdP n=1 Tax=Tatumella saanichensis TaxID=480813 RepID=UPI0004A27991|nr:AsmA2 domain-containing protein YhdP [Tatumella saanichensis]